MVIFTLEEPGKHLKQVIKVNSTNEKTKLQHVPPGNDVLRKTHHFYGIPAESTWHEPSHEKAD